MIRIFENTGYCPGCGVAGRLLLPKHDVFVCPVCAAVFSEFGFVVEPNSSKAGVT